MKDLSDSVCVQLNRQQCALVFDNRETMERHEMKDVVTALQIYRENIFFLMFTKLRYMGTTIILNNY